MKVWITKYALTQGIYAAEAEEPKPGFENMIVVEDPSGHGYCDSYFHGEGREWHRTHQEAALRANRMVQDKIASLKKQLERLEKMSF